MQIVINLSKKVYQNIIVGYDFYDGGTLIHEAVRTGTVLPENHGRLIDADKLFQQVGDIKPKSQSEHDDIGNFMNLITDANTILKAREDEVE